MMLVCLSLTPHTDSSSAPEETVEVAAIPHRGRFATWLANIEATDSAVAGLYPYFRSDEEDFRSSADDFISPMASAKCVLLWVEVGDLERASRTAERLVYWQEKLSGGSHPRVAGALPSAIHFNGGMWKAGDRFYSGDNLVVLDALLTLYERTDREEFLRAGARIARWLKDTMGHGERYGMWRECYFAPMHFVTSNGDFDNRIYTNTAFLWMDALRRFGVTTGKDEYIHHFERAKDFFLKGQSRHGVWFDHYDPGYPPKKYSEHRWRWYGEGGVVVGDNALRAALAAFRVGARDRAERSADWLKPENGAVPAYLDAATGTGIFREPTRPYYDVVGSGLWRVLASQLHRHEEARLAERFLGRTQNANGGWYWGLERDGLRPVQKSEAVITGFWAVRELKH